MVKDSTKTNVTSSVTLGSIWLVSESVTFSYHHKYYIHSFQHHPFLNTLLKFTTLAWMTGSSPVVLVPIAAPSHVRTAALTNGYRRTHRHEGQQVSRVVQRWQPGPLVPQGSALWNHGPPVQCLAGLQDDKRPYRSRHVLVLCNLFRYWLSIMNGKESPC